MASDPNTAPAVPDLKRPDLRLPNSNLNMSSVATDGDAASPSARNHGQDPNVDSSRGNVWLGRIRALVFVTLCATFGVLLLILPWTSRWTDNPWLLSFPRLRDFISSGFVRGLSSGLGLLDLWLGFWEAVHYHEIPN